MIEYEDIWYKDDGALTYIFCEESEFTLIILHILDLSNQDNMKT